MDTHDSRPMTGKTVLVTGASGGIGMATAIGLAKLGARVSVVGRDRERVLAAERAVRSAGGESAPAFVADLSSQGEVRRLATEVLVNLPRLDVLVNNAGGYWNSRHTTDDGLERTFALNHLAPFLLTNLLLHRLADAPAARVVTVSSNAQAWGRMNFDDLQGVEGYSGARAYNQSKLGNVLFTYELARKIQGSSVTANALHPGMVSTSFGREDPVRLQRLLVPFMRPMMKSPSRGAATSIHVASSPAIGEVSGQFYAGSRPKRTSSLSYDTAVAARLWKVSAQLTRLAVPARD